MDDVFEAELAGGRGPRRRTSMAGWFVIGLFISMLLIPVLYAWLPGEVARWYQAAAEEQRLDGDLEGALQSLDRALEQFPDRANLLLTRAEWSRESGDYEQALVDCERALTLAPNSPTGLQLRSQILQHLGRFDEAVQDALKLLELSERRFGLGRGSFLNTVAYARALANADLDTALEEINESIRMIEPANGPQGALLDTRGFIHYLRGEYQQAKGDMDKAVDLIESNYAELSRQLSGEIVGAIDLRQGELSKERLAESVAVIRYHRALVYEALGDESAAEEDRQRVRELGHEPSPALF